MLTVAQKPCWWRRRGALEKCLIIFSVFTLIVIVTLGIGVIHVLHSKKEANSETITTAALHAVDAGYNGKLKSSAGNDDVCYTKQCLHTAASVLSKMKTEVDPCDDFYEFACGTFVDEEDIPEDKDAVNSFSIMGDKLQKQLKQLISTERSATDPKHYRLPNILYKACMNKALIKSRGTAPVVKVAETLGGWPLLLGDAWNADATWTWQAFFAKSRLLGLTTDQLIDLSVDEDLKNSSQRIIMLDQPAFGLNLDYLVKGFNESLVTAYYDYMVDIAVLFGADKALAQQELLKSLEFEIALAKISLPDEKRKDHSKLNNLRTVQQLQELYPYVQWLDFINSLLPQELTINEEEPINLIVTSYLDELGALLAATPNRVVANYLMWRMHLQSVAFLTEDFRKREVLYQKELYGIEEQEARWKQCVNSVTDNLPISVGSLYVQKYFNQESKKIALDMFKDISGVYGELLSNVAWMDELTKQEAKKKLALITPHFGYPDELLDNEKLAKYYEKLEINPDQLYESSLGISLFKTDRSYNKLRLAVNKTDWESHAEPAVINAFYSQQEVSIQIPAGVLQGNFFHAQRPKYMNYGSIGFVIGHELTHGFDDVGRQYDIDGNVRDWWQEETAKEYLKKAKCMIEQYNNYTDTLTELQINGDKTQSENIADNGGVKESYLAYKQWVLQNGKEPKLPGLDYTPEQTFWIAAAQTWCDKARKEAQKTVIITNAHAPSQFRVLGPLKNMKEFSLDFQCPEGSPMNPVHKCAVW